MFDLLLKRKEAKDRREWYQTGTIAAAVVNFSMCHPEKQVSAEDYVPGIKQEKKEFDLTKLSPEDQAKYVLGQFSKKIYNRRGKR